MILSCRDVVVEFHTKNGILRAVDGVDLDIEPGQTVALVGESGCGKSTLARAIMGLNKVKSGSIRLDGVELTDLRERALRVHRPKLQMVFQNPYSSLNPRLTVGRIIEEPLMVQNIGTPEDRRRRTHELLERVGLTSVAASQYPHEFSGGQRQRIAIARALALNPKLIVCDEPVSALDVSVQAQVLNLLVELQRDLGISYLFISHDLSVVRHLAHRTVVMYLGRIAARSDSRNFWDKPLHPYVRALKDATPTMDVLAEDYVPQPLLEGEIPSALNPPQGCRFSTRCAWRTESCTTIVPELRKVHADAWVACHHITTGPDGTVLAPWETAPVSACAER
ncbi:ABC transporter ATP-binding protein [Ferrovibrio sp.]|uniref:ABC transporter ATP-binding protein n=1 Tax=Ferrovibrio sp. TaxID=1917215 RepID=UPI0035B376E5